MVSLPSSSWFYWDEQAEIKYISAQLAEMTFLTLMIETKILHHPLCVQHPQTSPCRVGWIFCYFRHWKRLHSAFTPSNKLLRPALQSWVRQTWERGQCLQEHRLGGMWGFPGDTRSHHWPHDVFWAGWPAFRGSMLSERQRTHIVTQRSAWQCCCFCVPCCDQRIIVWVGNYI